MDKQGIKHSIMPWWLQITIGLILLGFCIDEFDLFALVLGIINVFGGGVVYLIDRRGCCG